MEELTQRERLVARMVRDGLKTEEIAERIGISRTAVGISLRRVYDKFGYGYIGNQHTNAVRLTADLLLPLDSPLRRKDT